MSLEAAADRERLTVVLDVRHPFSYLALGPSCALVRETGVVAEWLPIRALTLAAPAPPGADEDRGTRHRRFRAEMIAREISVYAAAQGLTIESPYRDGGAEALHLAWLWVQASVPAHLDAFLGEAFRGYWSLALDPERFPDVVSLLDGLALDSARFRAWAEREGADALAASAARAAALGLLQAPGYRLGEEVFFGRQHLPMIRWLLGGCVGEKPI